MSKKVSIGIVGAMILLVVILIPFLINNKFTENSAYLAIYVVSKSLLGAMFLLSVIRLLVKKASDGITTIILGISGLMQLFPLFIRLDLSFDKAAPLVVSSLLLIISFLIYSLLLIGVEVMDKKMLKVENKGEGRETNVQDEHDLYDENNHFKG